MTTFHINDKIIVNNSNSIWNNYKGIVIAIKTTQDNSDLDLITTKLEIKTDNGVKFFIQEFNASDLILENEKNENLLEALNNSNFTSLSTFINFVLNQPCKFKGLDYTKIYPYEEIINKDSEGHIKKEYKFSTTDKFEIDYFESLKQLDGKIISCSLDQDFNPDVSGLENFKNCYWDIEFENGDVLNTISGKNIQLIHQKILESTAKNKLLDIVDYIKNYVYINNIPTYIDITKIAQAEEYSVDKIISDTIKFSKIKQKQYHIFICYRTDNNKKKIFISAPEYSAYRIYQQFTSEEQQNIQIKEIKYVFTND